MSVGGLGADLIGSGGCVYVVQGASAGSGVCGVLGSAGPGGPGASVCWAGVCIFLCCYHLMGRRWSVSVGRVRVSVPLVSITPWSSAKTL